MAQVTLTIGGRVHAIGCRDGEEAHIQQLGRMIEERAAGAARAAGNAGPERMMLLIALMLADDLFEAERVPVPVVASAPAMPAVAPAPAQDVAEAVATFRREAEERADRTLAAIAKRLEAIATALETDARTS